MRIMLDENLPLPLLKAFAPAHEVTTVQSIGMSGVANGELLARLEGRFDVFVTADKKLKYKQNLRGRALAIVEVPSNRLPVLTTIFDQIAATVTDAKPGDYIAILLDG